MTGAQHGECVKCHWIADFKIVNFMLYKFYLNRIIKHMKVLVSISQRQNSLRLSDLWKYKNLKNKNKQIKENKTKKSTLRLEFLSSGGQVGPLYAITAIMLWMWKQTFKLLRCHHFPLWTYALTPMPCASSSPQSAIFSLLFWLIKRYEDKNDSLS